MPLILPPRSVESISRMIKIYLDCAMTDVRMFPDEPAYRTKARTLALLAAQCGVIEGWEFTGISNEISYLFRRVIGYEQ